MLVLGLADHVNCGSALVRDGRVIGALNDERLVREKMVFGVPRESIRTLLEICDVSPDAIDAVAVATRRQHLIDGYVDFRDGWFGLERGRFKQTLFELGSRLAQQRGRVPGLETAYYALRAPAYSRRRRRLGEILADEFGIRAPLHFLDHHFCHVASAYYTSGFREATVFSIDGGGDGRSGSVYDVVDGRFEPLCEIPSFDSLGNFYSYVTQLCGYKAGRHEGKITGLAAFGEPRYVPRLEHLFRFREGAFENRGRVFFHSALEALERALPADFLHRDLAASVQELAEELVTSQVRWWVDRTHHGNVALAGGVAANVRINQCVRELPEVKGLYVHPGMSDEGLPVGAALARHHQESGRWCEPGVERAMPHVYLGPSYTDTEIEAELTRQGVEARRHDDVETEIARRLADDQVVARFDGRMEYGPRALGNRSILYPTTDPSAHHWLNRALSRTEFMPFAPVVLAEHADRCFRDIDGAEDAARFMTLTFHCTPWMIEHCPAVVHVDGTARPQLVSAEDNPSLHRLLRVYHDLTGLPCLVNTSFNLHEEPIVCTPTDAIRAFRKGHLDHLAIGSWIATNPEPAPRDADDHAFRDALERRGSRRPGKRA